MHAAAPGLHTPAFGFLSRHLVQSHNLFASPAGGVVAITDGIVVLRLLQHSMHVLHQLVEVALHDFLAISRIS
jgi:hypothetical protein